jgi:hypothetical protein
MFDTNVVKFGSTFRDALSDSMLVRICAELVVDTDGFDTIPYKPVVRSGSAMVTIAVLYSPSCVCKELRTELINGACVRVELSVCSHGLNVWITLDDK